MKHADTSHKTSRGVSAIDGGNVGGTFVVVNGNLCYAERERRADENVPATIWSGSEKYRSSVLQSRAQA